MSERERHPTRDQLLAMAYVDDELEEEARQELDQRMANEPELRREVAELQALNVIARRIAPPEPMDHEWAELEREPLQRGAGWLGMALVLVGTVGVGGWTIFEIVASDLPLFPKVSVTALLAGLFLLLATVLRGRLRTLPFDPYTKVKR
jgi:anti-sigma factor RsiW